MKRSLIVQLIGSQLSVEDENRVLGMYSAVERTVQILEGLRVIDTGNWEIEENNIQEGPSTDGK